MVRRCAFLGAAGFNYFNSDHQFATLGYRVRATILGGVASAATTVASRLPFASYGVAAY